MSQSSKLGFLMGQKNFRMLLCPLVGEISDWKHCFFACQFNLYQCSCGCITSIQSRKANCRHFTKKPNKSNQPFQKKVGKTMICLNWLAKRNRKKGEKNNKINRKMGEKWCQQPQVCSMIMNLYNKKPTEFSLTSPLQTD